MTRSRRAAVTDHGRRTRERLVAGAAELMREQGVEKTSLDQVLARTGTSKSQLYHYFDDKDALVREVIAYQTHRVLEQSRPFMDAVISWAALRAWFDAIVAAHEADDCRYGCPVGSLASELAGRDEPAREELAASFARWEASIRALLERLQRRGRLQPRTDTRMLAMATLASVQGGLLLSKAHRDPLPLRAALDANYAYLRSFAMKPSS